jgi:hypothetical protein
MSVADQTRSSDRNGARSVDPLIADLRWKHRHDRFVPLPDARLAASGTFRPKLSFRLDSVIAASLGLRTRCPR